MPANRSSVPRWFRTLLWLLPSDIRSDHGREMTQVFNEERREIGEHRRLGQVGLWLRTSWGLLREARAAHAAIARHDAAATFRSMRRAPALTLTILLTLGLGIAAATTMFSIVDAVLLRPLPYPGADALVSVKEHSLKNPGERGTDVSYPAFLDLRQQAQTLEHVAASRFEEVILRGGAEPIREFAARVSPELFSVLRVQPALGRIFTTEENAPGSRAVIIGHELWQRLFGGNVRLADLKLRMGQTSLDVVGVMPPSFGFPTPDTGIWLPIGALAAAPAMRDRTVHMNVVVGRLGAGASLEAARKELATLAVSIVDVGHTVSAMPLADDIVGASSTAIVTASVAIGLMLLLACVNTAGLLLARTLARRHEIIIRTAMGASRARLVRQHLTETLLLAVAGGALGVLMAWWSLALVHGALTKMVPRAEAIVLDGRALAFALLVSIGASLLVGLVPALAGSRAGVSEGLKTSRFGSAHILRLRSGLVIVELALSVVIVTGAGLMARSYWHVVNVPPGFRPDGLLSLRVTLPDSHYPDVASVVRFYRELPSRLAAIPGVEAVSAVNVVPISGGDSQGAVTIDGRPVPPGDAPTASYRRVLPSYFRTMQIPLIAGREFDERDQGQDPKVVIISDAMAKRLWTGGNPLGQRIKIGPADREPWLTVVGVVGDVRNVGLESEPTYDTYEPHAQRPWSTMRVLARTHGDPTRVGPDLRAALRQIDADLIVDHLETMDQRLSGSELARRFSTWLLAAFAALALVFAGVSVYGLTAYTVSARTREFGLRMALGATRRDVARAVLGGSLQLGLAGVAAGLLIVVPSVRATRSLLAAVDPIDPAVYGTVGVVLLILTVLAPSGPARRAMRIDPNRALRVD